MRCGKRLLAGGWWLVARGWKGKSTFALVLMKFNASSTELVFVGGGGKPFHQMNTKIFINGGCGGGVGWGGVGWGVYLKGCPKKGWAQDGPESI